MNNLALLGDILLAILDNNALVAAVNTLTGDVVDSTVALDGTVGNNFFDTIGNLG